MQAARLKKKPSHLKINESKQTHQHLHYVFFDVIFILRWFKCIACSLSIRNVNLVNLLHWNGFWSAVVKKKQLFHFKQIRTQIPFTQASVRSVHCILFVYNYNNNMRLIGRMKRERKKIKISGCRHRRRKAAYYIIISGRLSIYKHWFNTAFVSVSRDNFSNTIILSRSFIRNALLYPSNSIGSQQWRHLHCDGATSI